jgi:hypothetical protein
MSEFQLSVASNTLIQLRYERRHKQHKFIVTRLCVWCVSNVGRLVVRCLLTIAATIQAHHSFGKWSLLWLHTKASRCIVPPVLYLGRVFHCCVASRMSNCKLGEGNQWVTQLSYWQNGGNCSSLLQIQITTDLSFSSPYVVENKVNLS